MQKIVTIGGGTGHYQILRGLKNYDCKITSIVSVADNGGHSGELMDEFGVLPPGDLRQCLSALADDEKAGDLREIFEFRFETGNKAWPSIGNLIISALEKKHGRPEAIKRAGKLLGILGTVVPVSLDNFHIFAELENGKTLNGQAEVTYLDAGKIKSVHADPAPHVFKEAAEKIRDADKIVICSGDLYGSIIPNFLVQGVKEAIQESKAKIIYVCNLVTKQGNYGYKASDFVKEIEKYLGKKMDKIIINSKIPSKETIKKYLDEKSEIVEDDLKIDSRVIRAELVEEYPAEKRTLLRHNPHKTAQVIMSA
jgi:uncharacterized cofD-like protein